jgi:hypothetical protein
LVCSVIPLAKLVTLPTTSLAKFCIPPTIEAAKAPPGRLGIDGAERPPPVVLGAGRDVLVVDALRRQVGS